MVVKNIFALSLCILCAYANILNVFQILQNQCYPNHVWTTSEKLQSKAIAKQLNYENFDPTVWSEKLSYENFNPIEWSENLSKIATNLDEWEKYANFDPELLANYLKQVNFNPYRWAKKLKQINVDLEEWDNVDLAFLQKFATRQVHPHLGLNAVEMIQQHGYIPETHYVTTKDGYILGLHRVVGQNTSTSYEEKPVVLVMGGILCSSADWVLSGPGKALAYLLADAGYDVWLGNNRGIPWSKDHVSLNPRKKKFWDFSYHEMGVYDLPALIDYILEQTQQPKLHYIGHSQGGTAFFVMASELPEYNQKIRLASALAPVTFSSNVKNPFIRLALPFENLAEPLFELMGIKQAIGTSRFITAMGQFFCNDDALTQDLCSLMLYLVCGFDEPQMNKTMLPVIFSNFPSGGSIKQFWHYAQTMKSAKFRKYDYGFTKNLVVYGQNSPPDYKLAKVSAPVATYYSTNDWISSDKDVRKLMDNLPNVVVDHLLAYRKFNHMDFLWAIDANSLLYNHVLKEMKNY